MLRPMAKIFQAGLLLNQNSKRALGVLLFVTALCLLQLVPGWFEYERQQILSGQLWRIWTAHLVHTNWTHLLLNSAAAVLLYCGFFSNTTLQELVLCSLLFSTLISLGLLVFCPNLNWYNGLSGLLHGLVAYGLVRLALKGEKVFWFGFAVLCLKVSIEAVRACLGIEAAMGDMAVITAAHLIGAIVGSFVALLFDACFKRWRESELNKN